MHYRDLRGWLDGVDSFGELRIVEGADWKQEIGAVDEHQLAAEERGTEDGGEQAVADLAAGDRDQPHDASGGLVFLGLLGLVRRRKR